MRTLNYTVPPEFDGKKLLSFLKGAAGLSSKLIRSLKMVDNGLQCNNEHIRTIDIIRTGDIITINIPADKTTSAPCDLEPDIVFEDDDLLIVNKPAMLPIHESHNHQGDTLANCVSGYLAKKGLGCTFRAIGRLDKGTSGLVVCALNSHAASRLSGEIKKTYYAIAIGEYSGSGTIDAPIYRPDPMKTYRTVDERGDRAVTHWEAIESKGGLTLLKIHLETGRTHQIRVHFSSNGTPLIGDRMYGGEDERINHQALHCGELTLTHPITGKKIHCSAPMPEEMTQFFRLDLQIYK
ncbi:MAG: RluA family pseudouridine synthase [Ruminococcus sp.]|nr:RluA family pseudouridine synthase [Ruminococcus sp.]